MININDREKIKKTGWVIKLRINGEEKIILKSEKQNSDIFRGNVLKYKVNRKFIKKENNQDVLCDNIIIVEEKKEKDILLDNVIDPNLIKVFRGGESIIINSLDMYDKTGKRKDEYLDDNCEIEYKYLKWELKEEDGKCVECTDQEKKAYVLDNFIKPELINKFKNTEKAVLNPAENAGDYQKELKEIEKLSYSDLKKVKIK